MFVNRMYQREACQAVFNNTNTEIIQRGISAVLIYFFKVRIQFVIKTCMKKTFVIVPGTNKEWYFFLL